MESAQNRGYFAPQGWLPTPGLRVASDRPTGGAHGVKKIRCAIYTRKSAEEGLEQDFNSLDAQREACAAYVASQKAEGWVLLPTVYEDGGISGGTLERPGLQLCLLFIHPPAHGSEVSPAVRNTLDSARIPRASKLLICGLFQKGRVLAQDGILNTHVPKPSDTVRLH